jgi:hypothetical protein
MLPTHLSGSLGPSQICILQTREQGGEQQTLLRLPHIFAGSSLRKTMSYESIESVLQDLTASLGNQERRHILQHHRL